MTDDILPLRVWPWPLTADTRLSLRAAKATLNLELKVQPIQPHYGDNGYGRVLALGERPNFVCDHALVRDSSNVEMLASAMLWALGETEDSRATTLAQHLAIMLPGTTEVSPRVLAYENASKNLDLDDMKSTEWK